MVLWELAISTIGSAGNSLLPKGVHCLNTLSPNMASFASFHANIGSLLSLHMLWYFSSTLSADSSLALFIGDNGKRFLPFVLIGNGDNVDTVDTVDTVSVVDTVGNSVDCI